MKIEKLLEFTLEFQKPSASKTSRLSYSWSLFSSTNLLREKNDNYDEKKASKSLDFFAPKIIWCLHKNTASQMYWRT